MSTTSIIAIIGIILCATVIAICCWRAVHLTHRDNLSKPLNRDNNHSN